METSVLPNKELGVGSPPLLINSKTSVKKQADLSLSLPLLQ